MTKQNRQSDASISSGAHRVIWVATILAALLAAGIGLGLAGHFDSASRKTPARAGDGDQDALAAGSDGRVVNPRVSKSAAANAGALGEEKREAEEAAREQQQAALDAARRELDAKAAEQADKERRLAEEQARVEAERASAAAARASAAAAAAEVERQRAAAEEQRRIAEIERAQQDAARASQGRRYQGPSSGEIVWRGEVHGTELVTIEGKASNTGEVISGALPGVPVMVQPVDVKHVGVAVSPAPSNEFRRLVLRVQGNGSMQEVVHWSLP